MNYHCISMPGLGQGLGSGLVWDRIWDPDCVGDRDRVRIGVGIGIVLDRGWGLHLGPGLR